MEVWFWDVDELASGYIMHRVRNNAWKKEGYGDVIERTQEVGFEGQIHPRINPAEF